MTDEEAYQLQRAKELQAQAEDRASRLIARASSVDDLRLQVDALVDQVKYIRYHADKDRKELRHEIEKLKKQTPDDPK